MTTHATTNPTTDPANTAELHHDDGRSHPAADGRTSEPFTLGDAKSQLGITPLGPDRDNPARSAVGNITCGVEVING